MMVPTRIVCTGVVLVALSGCRGGISDSDRIVVTCGVVLGLDAKNAARADWTGETRAWSAEAIDDTLRLVRTGRCGDACTFVDQIVLAGLSTPCPRLVRATSTRRDAGSPGAEKIVEATRGSLGIQDWDPLGVVSGRLVAELSFTFHLNLARQE